MALHPPDKVLELERSALEYLQTIHSPLFSHKIIEIKRSPSLAATAISTVLVFIMAGEGGKKNTGLASSQSVPRFLSR